MARAIVITSGKGGVGKTTLAVCMGRVLASGGKRVALVDADMGLNNLDVLMGVENKVVYDIVDVIENRCRVRQALIEDYAVRNLFVLPSVHGYDRSRVDGQSMRAVVNSLKAACDIVLIDCPAGIELGFHRAVCAADEAIVVTTPHLSALRDAGKVIGLLGAYRLAGVCAVLNRVRGDLERSGEEATAADVEKYLGVPLLGAVPDDDGINLLSSAGEEGRRREGRLAVEMTCRNLLVGGGEIYDAQKKYRGILGGLKRRMKRIV